MAVVVDSVVQPGALAVVPSAEILRESPDTAVPKAPEAPSVLLIRTIIHPAANMLADKLSWLGQVGAVYFGGGGGGDQGGSTSGGGGGGSSYIGGPGVTNADLGNISGNASSGTTPGK